MDVPQRRLLTLTASDGQGGVVSAISFVIRVFDLVITPTAIFLCIPYEGTSLTSPGYCARPGTEREQIAGFLQRVHTEGQSLKKVRFPAFGIYDAALVQPIHIVSEQGLWKAVDVGLIDGAVNGVADAVGGGSEILRRLQTGSVRAYAASLFLGVVMVLGYYLWR